MIEAVLKTMSRELNLYLDSKYRKQANGTQLVLPGHVHQDGAVAFEEENKIIASVINIERELNRRQFQTRSADDGSYSATTRPPFELNIYLLFSAFFNTDNYLKGLEYLSGVMRYFQEYGLYQTPADSELATVGIHKLSFEFVNLNLQEMSNLWGAMGSKYIPSLIIKTRLVVIDEGTIRESLPAISGAETETER